MQKETEWSADRKQDRITQDHLRASRKQVFVTEDHEKPAGLPYTVPEACAAHQGKQEIISLSTVLTLGVLDALGWDRCFQM